MSQDAMQRADPLALRKGVRGDMLIALVKDGHGCKPFSGSTAVQPASAYLLGANVWKQPRVAAPTTSPCPGAGPVPGLSEARPCRPGTLPRAICPLGRRQENRPAPEQPDGIGGGHITRVGPPL